MRQLQFTLCSRRFHHRLRLPPLPHGLPRHNSHSMGARERLNATLPLVYLDSLRLAQLWCLMNTLILRLRSAGYWRTILSRLVSFANSCKTQTMRGLPSRYVSRCKEQIRTHYNLYGQIFVLDHRNHPTGSLYHPQLAQMQGPALLAYNDALFHDDDWKALQTIHQSSKKMDTSYVLPR